MRVVVFYGLVVGRHSVRNPFLEKVGNIHAPNQNAPSYSRTHVGQLFTIRTIAEAVVIVTPMVTRGTVLMVMACDQCFLSLRSLWMINFSRFNRG